MPITEPGVSIASIPFDRGIERFGQIQRIIFQRKYEENTDLNELDATTQDPKLKATWETLLAAEDGTKVTVSPPLSEPENEVGEARTYGGGNATINGIEITLGKNPSPFMGKFLEVKQHVIKELQKLQGELLSVYFVNEAGRIGMLSDGKDPVEKYKPIPIYSLFVSDKKFGNFEEPDMNEISFVLEPNWSKFFVIVTPEDFNPLHDLKNPD